MFYVCCKRGDEFGIFDTDDGVIEYLTPKEIARVLRRYNLDIEGAEIRDGRLHLTVKKPVIFTDGMTVSTNVEVPVKRTLTPVISEDLEGKIFTGYVSSFEDLYENTLRSVFIDKSERILGIMIYAIEFLTGAPCGYMVEDIIDLDGWDCVGFDTRISTINPKYLISVFFNPEVKVKKSLKGYELLEVNNTGFGCDIMIENNIVEHIECNIDTWKKDITDSEGWKLLNS